MKTTIEYLDAYKAKLGVDSDYAAAKALGVTRSAVSNYRNGSRGFDDATAVRIAEVLDVNPMEVIAAVHGEWARTEDMREFWEGVWGKVTGATVATAMAVGLAAAPSVAEAATIQSIVSSLHVM
ncbi:DUF3693 domain-containing protein [Burkholderia orbicola]|uniref:helix-turn-helix domain-containing protein n=1 Tax=Burkholderia orbicola TaxID=2978683 RepID=UPI00264F285E|nr:helix-turn-helix domain-containing protein [Burkholderia orbicola]ELW9447700.1 helix-turn-helix domain-containing protein [Burkholderia cenocepacia]MDN7467432.1 DUF3693 domain-containing protein [Burkholderia orbicola]MDN7503022.1 DUF3693 domain-containing protein [Burkholderia orbicola]